VSTLHATSDFQNLSEEVLFDTRVSLSSHRRARPAIPFFSERSIAERQAGAFFYFGTKLEKPSSFRSPILLLNGQFLSFGFLPGFLSRALTAGCSTIELFDFPQRHPASRLTLEPACSLDSRPP